MPDVPWQDIEALFEEALQRPAAEREAFLEARCESEEVRQEVASLLAAYEEQGDFFNHLAKEAVAPMLGKLKESPEERSLPTPSDPLGLEGAALGRYVVAEHLGGGGMGVVYRARDAELGRSVALKFLPPRLSPLEEAQERFAREAKSAAALDHANIATVHEIGATTTGRRFIAMSYYEGETLKEKLEREGRLPIEEAVTYAVQIAEGLTAAHAAGIVHRDVKPANVMVTTGGKVKLVDFGLAQVAAEARLTDPGQRMGTVSYMSPEQAEGKPVDARADLWSLGVVLYEMLTGERPFRGEREMTVLHAILRKEPVPIDQLRSEVPAALVQVIRDLLEKAPSDRPGNASDVAGRLKETCRMLTASKTLAQRPEEQNGWKAWTTPGAVWTRPTRVLAAAVLIAGLLAYATVRLTSPSFPRESAGKTAGSQVENRTYGLQANGWAPRLGEQSIAVLPFSYRAAADSSDYFSLGMTDELIVRLSQVEDLSVISRSSSMKYQDGTVPPHEIGRELGVAYVLEGRVQQFDGQVRVQVQLIDVRTDQNVWAQGFTRAFEDVLQLQVDLAREIARQLKANLMPRTERQMASAGRVDSAAYALYLQARQLRFLETAKGLSEAVRLLRRSITRDSTFAPAWATLSFCAWLGPILGSSMPEGLAGHSLAREAARRALELDSTSAKAHVAMGTVREVLDGDFPAAGLHYQRAIRLNPGLANAHREYGLYFARMGRFEIAERSLRKAARLNPASPVAIRDLGRNALRMGSYDQAKRYLKQALALLPDPTVRPALWTDARPALWEVYFAQDSVRLALRKIRRVVERNSHVVPLAYLGRAYASLGRRDSAKLVLRRIQQEYTSPPADAILSPADAIVPTAEAVVRAALGQSGRAAELLKQADFFRHSTYLIKTLPMLDPLRGEPLVQRAFAKWGIDEVSIQRTMERLSPELPDIEN